MLILYSPKCWDCKIIPPHPALFQCFKKSESPQPRKKKKDKEKEKSQSQKDEDGIKEALPYFIYL